MTFPHRYLRSLRATLTWWCHTSINWCKECTRLQQLNEVLYCISQLHITEQLTTSRQFETPCIHLHLSRQAFGAQTLSGTGALRVASEFLVQHLRYKTVYLSNPTWGEHYVTFD